MASLASLKIKLYKIRVFGFEKLSLLWDKFLFLLHVYSNSKTIEGKVILFVGEQLPPRIPRMAKWIKRKSDYKMILLCHQRGFVAKFSDPCFDNTIIFRNEWHLRRILKNLKNVNIIHGFAPKSYFPNIARTFLKKPYVHDMQDVYTIYYSDDVKLNWLKRELPHEADCLKHADGIVANSLEINVALRKLCTHNKPKTIFFPLYCDDDFYIERNKRDDNEIHIAYAGGVAGSFRNPAQYGNIQFQKLIKTITSQNIHFHIYPSPSNIRADYEEYEKLAEENKYFHFYQPIAQQKLSAELSKYDFGILPFFKELSEQSDIKLKYATTLKLFNFLEAGLPVLVSKDIAYQNWILKRYGCGLDLEMNSLNDISKVINDIDYGKLSQNVLKTRNKLSMEINISRLLDFYKIVENKKI